MKDLKDIINALKEIRTETKTKVTDEMLWDTAVRIFNSQKINRQVGNCSKISLDSPPEQLATPKQVDTMAKLDIAYDETTTKKQAQKKIDNEDEVFQEKMWEDHVTNKTFKSKK